MLFYFGFLADSNSIADLKLRLYLDESVHCSRHFCDGDRLSEKHLSHVETCWVLYAQHDDWTFQAKLSICFSFNPITKLTDFGNSVIFCKIAGQSKVVK